MEEKHGENKRKTLFLIDGSSVVYRAFHAIPQTLSSSKGLPTNAIYGFTQTLRKILKDYSPDYIGVAFDVKGPSFRHGLFTEYKAGRPPMPNNLSVQIPFIKRMVRAFGVQVLEKESFEADDVIATVIKKLKGKHLKIVLITGDKDMFQLVGENTVVLDYLTGEEYGPGEVVDKFGVGPSLMRDLLGLAGDTSDNIPGVPGVGVKTASKLLNEYGSMDDIFKNVEAISAKKLKENLKSHRDQALLSRDLATLHPDVPVEFTLEDLVSKSPDVEELTAILKELEFTKVLKEITQAQGEAGVEAHRVDTVKTLEELRNELKGRKALSITVNRTDTGIVDALALAVSPEKIYYIPLDGGLTLKEAAEGLRDVLEDDGISKDTDDSKGLYLFFSTTGVEVRGVRIDTSIASYLINPSKPDHSIEALSIEHLGSGVGEGGPAIIASKKACNIIKIAEILDKTLKADGLFELYLEMELPLARVLADMEALGIRVDREKLQDLSRELERELTALESGIYSAAGVEFNINSPKQLSSILFERLKLKPVKRTKTGFSTDEEVLTRLSVEHDVPRLIISFRQLAKLKSTYVDALLGLIDPATGRVHTSFNQTVTATGRLSSSNPNLQNIPVRGEAAGRIREAFVPGEGYTFLAADYSQIELRIVAHLSGDPSLIDAFMKDEDIHTRTASEVFGIAPGLVTPEMRRRAKAINFGIIYGMGPYGLSTELGIPVREAEEYIDSYFSHYSSVKQFIERTVREARERGYTTTIFGRRRFIPELKSPVEQVVRLGERLAINTPVQGSSADIIKAAMLRIHKALKTGGFSSRMLLQIHDELLFEAAPNELEEVKALVKKEMEGIVRLRVPIKVNMKTGPNWRDAG